MDIAAIQTRLLAKGYDIGAADGMAGPKTWSAVLAYVASRPMAPMLELAKALPGYTVHYGILANTRRLSNFLGQAAHESGGFRYLREIWGPTRAQKTYEGRADLGNTQAGDGYRYLGRGIFQITGRANYRMIGDRIDQPLEDTPALAERPDIAVLTACDFWDLKHLNALADAGQEDAITRRINGGITGIEQRRQLVARAKGLFT